MKPQPWKAELPIEVRAFGYCIDASAEQPEKVESSIVLIPTGSIISVRALHSEKAELPIVVKLFGNKIFANDVQLVKAELPIDVRPFGSCMEESALQFAKEEVPILVVPLGRTTEGSILQPENAELPIVLTFLPIVSDVKPEQFSKAESEMLVVLSPIVTVFSEVRLLNQAPMVLLLTETVERFLYLSNTPAVILVTSSPITTSLIGLCQFCSHSSYQYPQPNQFPIVLQWKVAFVKFGQYANGWPPTVVKLCGKVTLVRPRQVAKAEERMDTTPSGIIKSLISVS